MDRFIELLRKGQIGLWCKRGAWTIVALGVVGIGLQVYWIWQQYHDLVSLNQGQPFTGVSSYYVNSFLLTDTFQLLISLIATIFFFLLLYFVGAVADTFAIPEQKDSDVIIESIDTGEAVPLDK